MANEINMNEGNLETQLQETNANNAAEMQQPQQLSAQEAVAINRDYMRNSGPMWNPAAPWAPYWALHSTTENDVFLVDDFKFNTNFLHIGDECEIHIISENCTINYVNAVLTQVEEHELTFSVVDAISMSEQTLTITSKMLNDLTVKRQIHIYGRQPNMMANAVPLPYRPQPMQPTYGYHPFGCRF